MRVPSALACLWILGCTEGPPPAQALRAGEDACAACRMSVSQAKFASQRVRRGRTAEFFDDLGCLARSVRERPLEKAEAAYVADFETGQWAPAAAATYVHAPSVPTPMSSGLISFSARAGAEKRAAEWGGRLLGWQELLEQGRPAAAVGR